MTAKTSRIIIKTFVKTALKDADEAPERCTRNLVDMALHFSKGRFQISFFEMARTMLNNENSPYYPLIEDALKHMDKDKLIEFGLNLGYNGCTMGAHIVRKIKRTENINVPWLLFLNIDSAHENLTESYQPIFDQGKDLGIYVYFLYTNKDPERLLPLIRQNEDCAIILLCGSDCITEDFADSAKDINHLLIGVTIIPMLHASYSAITDFFILYIACLQKMKVPKFFPVHTTAMPKNFTVRFPQSLRIRHAAVKPVEMSTKQPSVHVLHRNTVLFRLILCMMQKLSETLSLRRPV